MQLHKSPEDFKDLILIAADYLRLDPTIIEKDYWISHSLYHLSKSKYKDVVVFKGGTSLTKCYEDLHRFSEDIDIALLTNGMSKSQVKKTISKIEEVMSANLQPGEFEGERKSGDYRYTQFRFESLFTESLMELHPNIRFELTSFMQPHPFELKKVGSFVQRYLSEQGMEEIIQEFRLERFELNVLSIERTVIEKLVSLIRMSYETELKEFLTKTRHLYDLNVTYNMVREFYNDDEKLHEMILVVKDAEHDSRFKDMYPIENQWHTAPLFLVLDDPRIENAYRERFGVEFVYGKVPEFEDVKKVMLEIQQSLKRCGL